MCVTLKDTRNSNPQFN